MLWNYELRSSDWWDSKYLIDICLVMLDLLTMMLRLNNLQSYFINHSCNLFDFDPNSPGYKHTVKKLIFFCNRNELTEWFKLHYFRNHLEQESEITGELGFFISIPWICWIQCRYDEGWSVVSTLPQIGNGTRTSSNSLSQTHFEHRQNISWTWDVFSSD